MPRFFRATYFLALTACAFAAAACGDPFAVKAPFQTVTDSFAISALTRTPASARALWRIADFVRYRLDSIGTQFDLGFDINASGTITVYPARTIAKPPPSAAKPVRIQAENVRSAANSVRSVASSSPPKFSGMAALLSDAVARQAPS